MESLWSTALSTGLVLVAGIQAFILIWQARISSDLKNLETDRRKEEGAVTGWARAEDLDTRETGEMLHGKIYQMAAWNQGARDQLVWNAEVKVIGTSKDGQYDATFAPIGGKDFLDGSWRIPAKSASRLQVHVDASVIDVAEMEQGWMFLRFKTPDGPDYAPITFPGGTEPSREEVLQGWVPRRT